MNVYLGLLLFVIVIWAYGKIAQVPIYNLVADPTEIGGISPLSGVLSKVGVFMWCASTAICFLSASLLKSIQSGMKSNLWLFLVGSGTLSLLLMLDDSFQLHESLAHAALQLLPSAMRWTILYKALESLIYLGYLGLLLSLIYFGRQTLAKSNGTLFAIALIFFGLSIFFDIVTPETMLGHYLLEEGCKFLGIGSWLIYYWDLCHKALTSKLSLY